MRPTPPSPPQSSVGVPIHESAKDPAPQSRPSDHGWPRRFRLRKRKDFAQVQRSGARAGGTLMVVLVRKSRAKDAPARMGFAVSKKVGNAPVRNRIKRRLRHLCRTQKELWHGLDVVLLLQPPAAEATFDELGAAFADGLGRARRALEAGKGQGGRKRRGGKRSKGANAAGRKDPSR